MSAVLDTLVEARIRRARPKGRVRPELRREVRQHLATEFRGAIGLSPCPAQSVSTRREFVNARGERVPLIVGAAASLFVLTSSGLRTMKVRYALAPADQVLASHHPTTFSPTRGYPPELQERDYANDPAEQLKVSAQASGFEPSLVVNSNPDAVNGPPIVDERMLVLGGNSRAMTIQRILATEPASYTPALLDALRSHCAALGLDGVSADDVAGHMLVRVLDEGELSGTDAVSISALLNRTLTQSMQRAAGAVSLGARLPAELVELLASELEDQATLAEVVARNESRIVAILRRADIVTARNQSTYVRERRGRPSLTRAGRDLVVDAILGAVVADKSLLASLEGRTVVAVERSAPVLLAIAAASGEHGYDLLSALRRALSAWAPLQGLDEPAWRAHWGNGTLFDAGGAPEIDAEAAVVLDWWRRRHRRPAELSRSLLSYYRAIPEQFRGGASLFSLADADVKAQGLDGVGLRASVLGMARFDDIADPAAWLAAGGAE